MVEPELVIEVRDLDRRRPWSEDRSGEVARDEVLEDEGEDRDAEKDDDRLGEPPKDVPDHVVQLVRVTFDNPDGWSGSSPRALARKNASC